MTFGLSEQVLCARAHWPQLAVDGADFARHLAQHAAEARAAPLHVADLYLAFACARGEPGAVAAFEQRHLSKVRSYIAHLRDEKSFVDEVRQRVRERLLLGGGRGGQPRLLAYSGRGPLGAWVRVTAVRQALDVLESERPAPAAADIEDDLLAAAVDPELVALRDRHLPQLREAFRGALGSLDAQERNLLKLYLVDGLNIARIGQIFGKSRATIGRMVVHCRAKLLDQTRQRLSVSTGGSASEVASLIRLLHSQLDVSIRGFLVRRVTVDRVA